MQMYPMMNSMLQWSRHQHQYYVDEAWVPIPSEARPTLTWTFLSCAQPNGIDIGVRVTADRGIATKFTGTDRRMDARVI